MLFPALRCYECIEPRTHINEWSCGDFDASKEIQCPASEFCVKAHMKVDGTKGVVHGCQDSVSNFGVDSKGTV